MSMDGIAFYGVAGKVAAGDPLANERMRITNDGNVGIGTTSPTNKLDVAGHINSGESYKIDGYTVLANPAPDNIFVGRYVGVSNTTGAGNSAMGYMALNKNTTGFANSAVGHVALYENTTGTDNSAMGDNALVHNTTGSLNSAMGSGALSANTIGGHNSAMGRDTLRSNTTGNDNSAMGDGALANNTTGNQNSALGAYALCFLTTGSNNTAVGYKAGWGYPNATGSGNVFLGYSAGSGETGSNKLYIHNSSGTPLIYGEFDTKMVGINTAAPAGYTLAVNGSAAKTGGGSWSTFSDIRLKDVHGSYQRGLSEVSHLNPVKYKYTSDNDMNLAADKEYVGLVAQDVQGVIPEAVEENSNGYLMVNNDPIIWAMVNAIKELRAENELLKQRIDALESRMQQPQLASAKGVQQ